jgi:hypothetical protein
MYPTLLFGETPTLSTVPVTMTYLLAANPVTTVIAKVLFLSLIIVMIVVPVRASRHDRVRGPQRAVFLYLISCGAYYFALRFVLPRLSV